MMLLLPALHQKAPPDLPVGWTGLEDLGVYVVHRQRVPMALHRVACDVSDLKRHLKAGPATARAEAAMDLLRRGAVRVVLTQEWLADLSAKARRERLVAFLDVHWSGAGPWRGRKAVERYLSLFSIPANTGDRVALAFDPSGRLLLRLGDAAQWVALEDKDLCRALLEGLLGPKALDQGLPLGLREALQARLAR